MKVLPNLYSQELDSKSEKVFLRGTEKIMSESLGKFEHSREGAPLPPLIQFE